MSGYDSTVEVGVATSPVTWHHFAAAVDVFVSTGKISYTPLNPGSKYDGTLELLAL